MSWEDFSAIHFDFSGVSGASRRDKTQAIFERLYQSEAPAAEALFDRIENLADPIQVNSVRTGPTGVFENAAGDWVFQINFSTIANQAHVNSFGQIVGFYDIEIVAHELAHIAYRALDPDISDYALFTSAADFLGKPSPVTNRIMDQMDLDDHIRPMARA